MMQKPEEGVCMGLIFCVLQRKESKVGLFVCLFVLIHRQASLAAPGGCPFIAFWGARLSPGWKQRGCQAERPLGQPRLHAPAGLSLLVLALGFSQCMQTSLLLFADSAVLCPNLTHFSSATLGSCKILLSLYSSFCLKLERWVLRHKVLLGLGWFLDWIFLQYFCLNIFPFVLNFV